MNKRTLLFIRSILILSTILVMVYSKKGLSVFEPGYAIAFIYFISNLLLYRLPQEKFSNPVFSFFIFLFDILIISLGIYFTGGLETDFYLIYYLAIFVSSVGQNLGGSIPIAIVASIIYAWLIHQSNPNLSFFNSAFLIRIPFLFIISLISSYWAESTRQELKKKEELERFNRALQQEVTKITAKEIELRQYTEKILNSVPSGVVAVNGDGVITALNPEAEKILGLKKEQVVGHKIKEISGLGALWEKLAQSINTGVSIVRQEITVQKPDNETFPIGLSVSPITDVKNKTSGCVAIFKDLSEIRALEEKLKHAERLSYLGKMASWVAHEIRNPLTSIDGFAQLLSNTKNIEKIKLFISEIRKGTKRINHIIDDILTFAKTKKVEYETINLRSLIASILKDIKTNVTINGDESPIIRGETESIRRLFINLINNSIEALDEDGKLQINFSTTGNYVITEIIDNGKGISKKDMGKLFAPFFTTKPRGTGLGLSIVKKIIDEHKGKIEITSEEGKGTTCRVYLPKV